MPELSVQFVAECHADTALIRFFFPDTRLCIHAQGCPEVGNTMMSPRASEYKLVGIVDNDDDLHKRCKGFFSAFEPVKQENRLFLRKHPMTNQHIVVVDKAIESFLLWNAECVKIDVSIYGFYSRTKHFRNQTKSPTIETDPAYYKLLTDLHTRQAPGFLTLERILNDLITT